MGIDMREEAQLLKNVAGIPPRLKQAVLNQQAATRAYLAQMQQAQQDLTATNVALPPVLGKALLALLDAGDIVVTRTPAVEPNQKHDGQVRVDDYGALKDTRLLTEGSIATSPRVAAAQPTVTATPKKTPKPNSPTH